MPVRVGHMEASVIVLYLVALVFAVWFAIVLPINMATARGRRPALWFMVSFFLSPFVAVALLLVLGDARKGAAGGQDRAG